MALWPAEHAWVLLLWQTWGWQVSWVLLLQQQMALWPAEHAWVLLLWQTWGWQVSWVLLLQQQMALWPAEHAWVLSVETAGVEKHMKVPNSQDRRRQTHEQCTACDSSNLGIQGGAHYPVSTHPCACWHEVCGCTVCKEHFCHPRLLHLCWIESQHSPAPFSQ
jgi:hypothetical protein